MAGQFGIVYPLWNHQESDASLLERAIGDVGIEHVTVPVITGPRSQFCLFGPRESPYLHTDGGWHYPPETKLYTTSGVRPRSAKWCGQRDVLRKVCELARASGIDVNVRIDLPSVRQLADHAPEMGQRNAWGEAYSDWGPCLNSPTYRQLLEAVIHDLLRYKPDGFELVNNRVDSLSLEIASTTFDRPFGPGFEICFCPACRQIAADKVDPEQAARSVRAHVTKFCASLRPGFTSDDLLHGLQSDEVLHTYVDTRVTAAERWLESLAQRHPEHQFFHGPVNYDSAHIGVRGLAGFRRIEVFDHESWQSAEQDDASPEAEQQHLTPEGIEMGLWFCWQEGADQLVRAVSESAERGVGYFDFAELDETPPETLAWLRQAVRYARRL
ncbi:MAG: hypothetical protein HZB38_08650 [Planctomycetes bacterium]|nr:hypothetical protein [Planctomycetota bacterium]